MTEPSPSILPRSKTPALSSDAQKRKKNSRKKSDAKSSNLHVEDTQTKPQENKFESYTHVINHINRLEHDVAIAKKQLKNQRKNFQKAISTLARHFDSQGISSDIIANYITSLGKREAQVEQLDEDYEKFYTGYKYQIVQDPKNLAPQPKITPENNNHLDVPKLTAEGETLTKEPDTTEKSEKKKKKSTVKAAVTNGEANGEEAPKKRKYQKKQKPTEEEEKKVVLSPPEVQEIPALTSGKNSAKKSAPRNEDSLKAYEEIPQLKQAEAKENHQRADPYEGMRGYLNQLGMDPMNMMNMYMPGFNMGMNIDGDYYNKMMQELMKSNMMQNNMMAYQRNLK